MSSQINLKKQQSWRNLTFWLENKGTVTETVTGIKTNVYGTEQRAHTGDLM